MQNGFTIIFLMEQRSLRIRARLGFNESNTMMYERVSRCSRLNGTMSSIRVLGWLI